jgi:hypothetical protein
VSKTDFEFPDPGIPRIPLDRLDINSEEAARYVAESRPFVSRVDWPATQWSPDYLRKKVGDSKVTITKRTRERVEITVNEFLDLVEAGHDVSDEYVIHNYPLMKLWGYGGPKEDFSALLEDLPLPAFIDPDNITEMYAWARNRGWYDNKSHCEPNAAAALNLQIRGKKHVWLFSPADASALGVASSREDMMEPPFFSAAQRVYKPSPEHPAFEYVTCYETVLEPGDVVHIPAFWYHWFVHYNLYQMNYNVWFTTESTPLSPVAGEWAYMNALCESLGGIAVAKEKFAALPEETQVLLHKIATTLINDSRCTDTRLVHALKLTGPAIQIDPAEFEKGRKER